MEQTQKNVITTAIKIDGVEGLEEVKNQLQILVDLAAQFVPFHTLNRLNLQFLILPF